MERKNKPLVYIAGPMTASNGWAWELNIREAEKVQVMLAGVGFSVHCPHTQWRNCQNLRPHTDCLAHDIPVVRRCDAIFMLPGWENSKGAREEHEVSELSGDKIRILYNMKEAIDFFKEWCDKNE